MRTYMEAVERLGARQSRKLQNNTYVQRRSDDTIAVRLHATDVVTYHADGRTVLDTGGWKTPVTKNRINTYAPINILVDRGQWYIAPDDWSDWKTTKANAVPYVGRTLTLNADGSVDGDLDSAKAEAKKEKKLRARVAQYARDYIVELLAGNVPEPSNGDCLYCHMVTVDGNVPLGEAVRDESHLMSHIEEPYYVPSLIVNALKAAGCGPAYFWALGDIWHKAEVEGGRGFMRDATDWHRVHGRAIRRYILKQLGMAA